jgi:hypothetical protein
MASDLPLAPAQAGNDHASFAWCSRGVNQWRRRASRFMHAPIVNNILLDGFGREVGVSRRPAQNRHDAGASKPAEGADLGWASRAVSQLVLAASGATCEVE